MIIYGILILIVVFAILQYRVNKQMLVVLQDYRERIDRLEEYIIENPTCGQDEEG